MILKARVSPCILTHDVTKQPLSRVFIYRGYKMMRKGFAIMLVLMMLFLLFMLGAAFFFSAWTHAFMARNYLNMKRAYVVAEGGVHTAIGNIIGDFAWVSHAQNRHVDFGWRYWGDDEHHDTGSPECIRKASQTPVEYARYPSYYLRDKDGNARQVLIFGKPCGLSGVMEGGAYGINSDIYHLKVTECSAQLYVNEGLGHPYNTAVMQRILNRLEEQIFELEYGKGTLGTRIMQNRPPDGYKNKAELKRVLGEQWKTVRDFLCVHTWSDNKVCNPVPLSIDAKDAYHMDFEDKAVYPAIYMTRPLNQEIKSEPITRYGRGKTITGGLNPELRMLFYGNGAGCTKDLGPTSIFGLDELNPCYIEITSRAPVNINTAPEEIIVALLSDIQGFYLMGQFRCPPDIFIRNGSFAAKHQWFYSPAHTGQLKANGELGVLFLTPPLRQDNMAARIADEIIKYRKVKPFRTWNEFNRFLDSLVETGIIKDPRGPAFFRAYDDYTLDTHLYQLYASRAIADAIKANFNPNLHLNELNPDASLWQWVDKTDLIRNSTEFCFLPTGYFEIESVGRILRAEWEDGRFHISPYLIIMKDSFKHNNQIMGQRRLKVEVKLWDLYRDTTQQNFYQGTTFSPNTGQYPTHGGLLA
jgi:hypothetical protein